MGIFDCTAAISTGDIVPVTAC